MDPRELPTATLPMVVPALCSTVVCGPHQTSLPQPWRGPRPFVPATRSVRRAPVPGKRLAPLPMFSVEAHRVQRRLRRRNKARGKGGGVLSPTSQHAFRARTPPEQGPQMRRRAPRPESSNAQLGIEEPPEYTRMVAQYLTGLAADIAAEQETTLAAYEAGEIDENGVWESEHARMELMSLARTRAPGGKAGAHHQCPAVARLHRRRQRPAHPAARGLDVDSGLRRQHRHAPRC
eukprot:TRINITY_DN11596_c0_g1_i2.p1 TRINITY_DN11596_c0_g1~~TRINITY_DN11596_c0_g1_i2.p1  ORF type:complete len:259 (+),score=58.82 TRINITY_DN11596_c0_g1_i2:78-779(+)